MRTLELVGWILRRILGLLSITFPHYVRIFLRRYICDILQPFCSENIGVGRMDTGDIVRMDIGGVIHHSAEPVSETQLPVQSVRFIVDCSYTSSSTYIYC